MTGIGTSRPVSVALTWVNQDSIADIENNPLGVQTVDNVTLLADYSRLGIIIICTID